MAGARAEEGPWREVDGLRREAERNWQALLMGQMGGGRGRKLHRTPRSSSGAESSSEPTQEEDEVGSGEKHVLDAFKCLVDT